MVMVRVHEFEPSTGYYLDEYFSRLFFADIALLLEKTKYKEKRCPDWPIKESFITQSPVGKKVNCKWGGERERGGNEIENDDPQSRRRRARGEGGGAQTGVSS